MSRKLGFPGERKLLWVGNSQDDMHAFPLSVAMEMLTALEVARLGGKHDRAKPLKGEGSGVFEILVDDGDAYRVVLHHSLQGSSYVLHAFQKKSTQGIKTPEREIETVGKRLKRAVRRSRGEIWQKKDTLTRKSKSPKVQEIFLPISDCQMQRSYRQK